MLDELVAEVAQKTGLSPEQAQAAVQAVVGFLKERLPAPIASHLDLLTGTAASATAAGGTGLVAEAESMLGGMFGPKS